MMMSTAIISYHYTMLYNIHSGEITRTNGQKSFLDDFPVVDYKVDTGMKIMPLSLIFVGMIPSTTYVCSMFKYPSTT